jgi:hypothetical protein
MKDRLFLKQMDENHFILKRIKDDIMTIEGDSEHFIHGITPFYKLNLENCKTVARGYDLDEDALEEMAEDMLRSKDWDNDITLPFNGGYIKGVIEGFKKAVELMGDKKFTEDDLDNAFECGYEMFDSTGKYNDILVEFKKSLQQTEWDVEIVTRSKNIDELRESKEGFLNNNNMRVPVLNSMGEIQLKRI